MTKYDDVKAQLVAEPKTWLVTGVAGLIGSNLLESLLKLNQKVTGIHNLANGHQHNPRRSTKLSNRRTMEQL